MSPLPRVAPMGKQEAFPFYVRPLPTLITIACRAALLYAAPAHLRPALHSRPTPYLSMGPSLTRTGRESYTRSAYGPTSYRPHPLAYSTGLSGAGLIPLFSQARPPRQQVTHNHTAGVLSPTNAAAHAAIEPARTQRPAAQPVRRNGADPPKAGETAFIPKECWPNSPCPEHGGAGWTVTVLSVTRHTAVVKFLHARTPSGAPYAPIRVQLQILRTLV
mmetsp:Transcript_31984/g.79649  ORF Transcript_31984/g.79649 Transcript_31984/m.79649 type:complete len:218 (+) Transcript_31984:1358-2011(+)